MALSQILAAHNAEVAAMFVQAQSELDSTPRRLCSCDYCRYPLRFNRKRKATHGLVPVTALGWSFASIATDPTLKLLYAQVDRSGWDATGGLPRIIARTHPEGFRDFSDELRKVDEQAPGPAISSSSHWFDTRTGVNLPRYRCVRCSERGEFVRPQDFTAHSKADLDRELCGYSRHPTQTGKPGKRPLTRSEARLVARTESDLERYSEYSDERTDREKQHDVAAYQRWQRRLVDTLNLPPALSGNAHLRRAVADIDHAPEVGEGVTERTRMRLREVELWIEQRRRNDDAVNDRWIAEHLGLTAPREREAFRGHLLGESLATTAQLMCVQVSTVKEWLKRARLQVRREKRDPWNRAERVPLRHTFKYEETQSAYERA